MALSPHARRVRLHTHWLARVLTRLLRADAVTLGHDVFLSTAAARSIAARTETGARLIAHEIAHVSQFAREGFVRFGVRYVAAYVVARFRGLHHAAAYSQIPFEIEAREAEKSAMWRAGLAVTDEPVVALLKLRVIAKRGSPTDASAAFLPPETGADETDPKA